MDVKSSNIKVLLHILCTSKIQPIFNAHLEVSYLLKQALLNIKRHNPVVLVTIYPPPQEHVCFDPVKRQLGKSSKLGLEEQGRFPK